MKWLRWDKGRQLDSGYSKMLLFLFGIPKLFGIDIYLIRFIPNCYLPTHKDSVNWGKHYRINIEIKGKGEFFCDNLIFSSSKVKLFRPDLEEHSMLNGNSKRLILSIGLVVRK